MRTGLTMNIQYLKTFKTITESQSFAQAAEKLGYTRSTITFQIRQVENEIGCKLFEKIGRKMFLTQRGQEILPYVDSILLNYQQITSTSGHPEGKVRISVVESYLNFRFPLVIRKIRKSFPEVELSIRTMPCPNMYDAIRNGEIDLALHYDTLGADPAIHTERIHDYPLVLFESTGADSPFRFHSNQRIAFIDLEEDGFYQHCLDHVLEENPGSALNPIVMGSVSSLIECVKSGLGIAVLPSFAIEKELDAGTARIIPAALQADSVAIAISYHQNKWLSPAIRAVLQVIQETA